MEDRFGRRGRSRIALRAAGGTLLVASGLAVLWLVTLGSDESNGQAPPAARAGGDGSPEAVTQAPSPRRPGERGAPTRPRAKDVGIFSELDSRVEVRVPSWIDPVPTVLLARGGDHYFVSGSTPVGLAGAGGAPVIEVGDFGVDDADHDGIPNALDVLIGAKKTVLNGARYEGGYYRLDYPGGDVDREIGVCTDVVVRAFRNAGLDLQKLLYEDIGRRPKAFAMVKQRNRNIDHRRVRTLLPYFVRHLTALDTDPKRGISDWLPGDVVFMDTMRGPGPDHIGILSDTLGDSGLPLVINNWTDGYKTSEMDLLEMVPVTHRFRLPWSGQGVPADQRGIEGLARRAGLEIPRDVRQLVAVTTPSWSSPQGELRRYERRGGRWKSVDKPISVAVGSAGLGRGRGVGAIATWARAPDKREGDRRAPAGLFELGTAFGRQGGGWRWPFRETDDDDRWVDDPDSPVYNTWQDAPGAWKSAERLADYRLAVVVGHNRDDVRAGAGSAIFLHTGDPGSGTLGCTVMDDKRLRTLIGWLDPDARPMLIQVPGTVY